MQTAEQTPPERPPILRFGHFELDAETLELRKDGVRKNLPPQPARLLLLLASQVGRPVSREEIRDKVWDPGVVVDFDHGMHTCIRQVRSALGDQADNPRYIRTLPKLGYSFLGPVEVVPRRTPTLPEAPRTVATPRRSGSLLGWLGLALLPLLAWILWPREPASASPPAGRIMLAVLPLEDTSSGGGDPWFADGLTEELIFHLARLAPERLGVIARSSVLGYADARPGVAEIGETLGVHYVLEGSVRRVEDRLRIKVMLVQVADQAAVWSNALEHSLTNVYAIEDRIADGIAQALRVELLTSRPTAPSVDPLSPPERTVQAAAFDAYLRGRFEWNQFTGESLQASIRHYTTSLELDPDLARSWAAMAESYDLLPFNGVLTPFEAYPKAKDAAARALELDDSLALAHNALGFAHLYFDWDWESSDAAFTRALELEPGYAMAHHWYAGLLSATGRHEEAIGEVRRALALDPLSLSVRSDLAWYLAYGDRHEEAVTEARETLDRAPDHGWARFGLALALQSLERTAETLEVLARMAERRGDDPLRGEILALDPTEEDVLERAWRLLLAPIEVERALERDAPCNFAAGYALVGDLDAAIQLLERALEVRDGWLVFLRVDPRFDALHGEPRYEEIAERVGLRQ